MKIKHLLFAILLYSNLSFAGVFLELLPGTDKIFRGRAPKATEMNILVETGITTIVIFKNQLKTEVDDEITSLTAVGISKKKIYHIPFLWKDVRSEQLACEQVIQALGVLAKVERSANDKVLFHCTVGEDRTGLLAGLMTQLLDQEDANQSYINQMCAKGYAGGNPSKPKNVSLTVDKYLTPLYFKISTLIQQGRLSRSHLDKKLCAEISTLDTESNQKTCSENTGR